MRPVVYFAVAALALACVASGEARSSCWPCCCTPTAGVPVMMMPASYAPMSSYVAPAYAIPQYYAAPSYAYAAPQFAAPATFHVPATISLTLTPAPAPAADVSATLKSLGTSIDILAKIVNRHADMLTAHEKRLGDVELHFLPPKKD